MTKDKINDKKMIEKLKSITEYRPILEKMEEQAKKEERKRIVKLMKDCMNLDEFIELQEILGDE